MTFQEEKSSIVWADTFPQMKAFPTRDPRVFQTPLVKVRINSDEPDAIFPMGKIKKYFCCVVGKECYGVEVVRKSAVDARAEYDKAFQKVVEAADYYEAHSVWPSHE